MYQIHKSHSLNNRNIIKRMCIDKTAPRLNSQFLIFDT